MVIAEARPLSRFRLEIAFRDGYRAVVDLSGHLEGEVFAPLREPTYFQRASFDSEAGTVVWPNGADFAPEFLRGLAEQREK